MGKSSRHLRRNVHNKNKKSAEKQMANKLNKFDRLGENCLICNADFDKKNTEMVHSWRVVVVEEDVKLYCPTCWERANSHLNRLEESNE
tara:strand:- start:324 stop:590 length:267 start_codon:yes stop_codon:yes gene_type:complete